MKRIMLNISLFLLVLTAGMSFVACSNHEPVIPIEYIDKPGFKVEIHVNNNPAATGFSRTAGPSDEDGYYGAFEHEHRVSDATIFFYQDKDGINGDAKTKIDYAVYVPTFASRKFDPINNKEDEPWTPPEKYDYVYYTPKQILCDEPIAKGTYHILIVCNQGNKTDWKNTKNLGDIRKEVTDQIYFQSGNSLTDCVYFTMVSNEDQTVDVGDFNPSDDPNLPNANIIELEASVERMAARIDFSPGDGTWNENPGISFTFQEKEYNIGQSYVYKVDKTEKDLFYLTSVVPVNLYNGDEYLIKRASTNDKPSAENLLVNYLIGENGNSNYVLDPNTLTGKKEIRWEDVATKDVYRNLYKNPMAEFYAEDGSKIRTCETNYPVVDVSKAKLNYTIEEKDGDNTVNHTYQVLSYTKENTILVGAVKNLYVTGLVFSGYYARWDSAENKYTYIPKSYIYYIRHNDPLNTSAELPMKYGIVRNHIYRVLLKSVNSLGIIVLEVMDWNPINAPEIDL